MASAVRSGLVHSSSSSRTSECRTTTSAPAVVSRTRSRTQPTMFWPKSTSVRPDGDCQTFDAGSTSVTRTGGPSGATSRARSASCPDSTSTGPSASPGVNRRSVRCPL